MNRGGATCILWVVMPMKHEHGHGYKDTTKLKIIGP